MQTPLVEAMSPRRRSCPFRMRGGRRRALAIAGALGFLMTSLPAGAQTPMNDAAQDEPTPGGGTSIMVGVGVGYVPEFEGAADNEAVVLPLFRVTDLYGFNLEPFALSYDLIDQRRAGSPFGLRAGPQIALDFGRDEDDSVFLDGLGNVDTAVLAGAFVNLRAGPVMLNVSGGQDIASGHEGALINARLGTPVRLAENLMLTPAISASWASQDYMQAYFGITPEQAASSIYDTFEPGAGIKDVGVNLNAQYEIASDWFATGLFSVSRLVGDAADSPIVTGPGGSATQAMVMFGLSRHF